MQFKLPICMSSHHLRLRMFVVNTSRKCRRKTAPFPLSENGALVGKTTVRRKDGTEIQETEIGFACYLTES